MQYDIMPSGMRIFQFMLPGENYGGKRRMSSKFNTDPTAKSERISRLVENLYRKMPEIEPDRAVLLTGKLQGDGGRTYYYAQGQGLCPYSCPYSNHYP